MANNYTVDARGSGGMTFYSVTGQDSDAIKKSNNDYDIAADKLWSVCISEAAKIDNALVESWKGDMDALLIFAGLFSAIVTAFLIDSYKTLKPTDAASTPAVLVNALWFSSLCSSLSCALLATLAQRWGRQYKQAVDRRQIAHVRGKVRAYLFEGVLKFRLPAVVELIPLLLHAAVLLFLAGLVALLSPLDQAIARLVLGITVFSTILYAIATTLPAIFFDCPYQTPLSHGVWAASQTVQYLISTYKGRPGDKTSARETMALNTTSQSGMRIYRSLRRTLMGLTDNSELEPFVEGISGFLRSESEGLFVFQKLLTDDELQLGNRLRQLLQSGSTSNGLSDWIRKKRVINTMEAILSLNIQIKVSPWHKYFGHHMKYDLYSFVNDEAEIALAAKCVLIIVSKKLADELLDLVRNQAQRLVESMHVDERSQFMSLDMLGARHLLAETAGIDLEREELIPGLESHLTGNFVDAESNRQKIWNKFCVLLLQSLLDELLDETNGVVLQGSIVERLVVDTFDNMTGQDYSLGKTDRDTQIHHVESVANCIAAGSTRRITTPAIIEKLLGQLISLEDVEAKVRAKVAATDYLISHPNSHAARRLVESF